MVIKSAHMRCNWKVWNLVSLRKKTFLDMLILVHKSFQVATPAYISVLFSLHLEPTLIGLEVQTSCSYRV